MAQGPSLPNCGLSTGRRPKATALARTRPQSETLLRFFRFLGKQRTAELQFICSDMWRAYLKVIAKKAPQAVHVLDRFHIMQRMSKALDKVRAAEVKQLKADGYEPVLKGAAGCF